MDSDSAISMTSDGLTRRDFLEASAGALVLGGAGGLLSACGSSGSKTTSASAGPTSKPKRGGTLRVGYSGGTSADTLDGQAVVNTVDIARAMSLYDPLVAWDLNGGGRLALAESIEPNATATKWTIRLRPDITFHNGKPLTADDLVYSIRRVVDNKFGPASSFARCDVKAIKKLDARTIAIPCTPYSTFVESLITQSVLFPILPVGFDKKKPIGTGPFKFKSFQPGVQSEFIRNENYWDQPYPYVDALLIIDSSDETAQVNGLLSGQVDCINAITPASAEAVKAGGKVVVPSKSGGWLPFVMRTDTRPFNDINVRQGMRYVVDRPAMLKAVYSGYGLIGNDIFSPFDPVYDHAIPQREQDLDRAKFLFRKAGVYGTTIPAPLVTSDIEGGAISAAQVLAEQASAAGLHITLNQVTPTEFYGKNYINWTFTQDFWFYEYYLIQASVATIPTGPWDETHFNNSRYTSLFDQATATLDKARQREFCHEMQLIEWNTGGYIIPFFVPVIDCYSPTVHGAAPSKVGISFANNNFASFWLS